MQCVLSTSELAIESFAFDSSELKLQMYMPHAIYISRCVWLEDGELLLMFPVFPAWKGWKVSWWLLSFSLSHLFFKHLHLYMLIHSHYVSSTWDLNHLLLYALQQISTGHQHYSHHHPVSQRAKVRRSHVSQNWNRGNQGSWKLNMGAYLEVSLGTGHPLGSIVSGFSFSFCYITISAGLLPCT